MWYTHTHTHRKEYYSAIKKNESLSFAGKWMELENILPSKPGSEKQRSHFSSDMCKIQIQI
jgi:hypothetical protein